MSEVKKKKKLIKYVNLKIPEKRKEKKKDIPESGGDEEFRRVEKRKKKMNVDVFYISGRGRRRKRRRRG